MTRSKIQTEYVLVRDGDELVRTPKLPSGLTAWRTIGYTDAGPVIEIDDERPEKHEEALTIDKASLFDERKPMTAKDVYKALPDPDEKATPDKTDIRDRGK